jgi:hypothetical protein
MVGIQHKVILYETAKENIYLQLVPAPPKVIQKFLFKNINPDALRKEELGRCNHNTNYGNNIKKVTQHISMQKTVLISIKDLLLLSLELGCGCKIKKNNRKRIAHLAGIAP